MSDQDNSQNTPPQVPNQVPPVQNAASTPVVDDEAQKVLDELKALKMQETVEMRNDSQVIDKKQIDLKEVKIEVQDLSDSMPPTQK